MSENVFGYQKWDVALTKDTDKHPTMHRTATHNKVCQCYCELCESLLWICLHIILINITITR